MRWLDGHDFEQTLGDDKGQGGLVCCSPWGFKELDTTELLNLEESPLPFLIILTHFYDNKVQH